MMRFGWVVLGIAVAIACSGCAGGGGEKGKNKDLDRPKAPPAAVRLR